ncbi:MAG: inositol monophosphatase [Planctomycetes bacterium]|nr:inositol monophosphatase [Planctomycetota bacterium]
MKQFLRDIIIEAGRMALDFQGRLSVLDVQRKSVRELVTEADKAVEAYLVSEILKRYPDHGILGEEQGERVGNEYRWLIDPIDGTTSFVHGQAYFGVSIGIEKAGEMVLGSVNFPAIDELYQADKGGGAYCNGKPIRVSTRDNLNDSVLATSFGCIDTTAANNNIAYFESINNEIMGIRNLGSAALHLCCVGCGQLEGYWQVNIKPWDVAAGLLIVEEAGGNCSKFSGGPSDLSTDFIASNGKIHNEMVRRFKAVQAIVSS